MLLIRKFFLVNVVAWIPLGLIAGEFEGYLTGSSGQIVTTPFGECVKSGSWNRDMERPDCTHDLKIKAKVYFDLNEKLKESDVSEATKKFLQKALDIVKGGEVGTRNRVSDKNNCEISDFSVDEDGMKRYQKAALLMSRACDNYIDVSDAEIAVEINYLLDESSSYGNILAMNAKAFLLADGDLLGYQDFDTALSLFSMSAEGGNHDALYNLGFMSEFGLGVPKDPNAASELYSRASGLSSILRLRNNAPIVPDMGEVNDKEEQAGDQSSMKDGVSEGEGKDIGGNGKSQLGGGEETYGNVSDEKPKKRKNQSPSVPYFRY